MDEIRCSIEIRADESRQSPGLLVGTLMVYGQRAKDRPELFERGSLSWPESGILVNRQHSRSAPIARLLPVIEGDSVMISAPLPDTVAGRDCATEIRSGLLTGMSVEFARAKSSIVAGVRRISEAVLTGAAIVDAGAYAAATVEVRAKHKRRQVWL